MEGKLGSNPGGSEIPARGPRVLARQLAIGFGLVSIVAVVMCGALLLQLIRVGDLVERMRHGEDPIRRGGQLVTAVREQYIHFAHTLIQGDDSHVEHYQEWAAKVLADLAALEAYVPAPEHWRVDEIRRSSTQLDQLFRDQLVPAIHDRDVEALRFAHERAEALAETAAQHADAVARAVEGRMVGAHISATDVTRVGLIQGLVCVGLVLLISVGFTIRLRRSVLMPLGRLTEAARSFGAGELHRRLGPIGRGELQEVASAFDRMADELVARQKQLVQVERMAAIGQFAAGVAHEMNNPIGIIRGYLKTMGPEEPPDLLREELRILDEEAAACQRIAEDLLAYARVPQLALGRVEMDAFLKESISRLSEAGEFEEARVRVEAEAGAIRADHARLRQILANLVRNAVQLAPAGEIVNVRGVRRADDGYEFQVSDRGPGVAAEARDRIFEPFYSRRAGGSGLGLAVCQGLVAAHGGHISVEEREGGGATFRVLLPAEPPARDFEGNAS
jgi:two-component system NtrC family sensor kinase